MMKTKVVILYLSILAVVSIAGCDSRHSYDARLRTADSLLRVNNPDSALQVLSVMDSAGLRSASDRAYHALLLTQAQYRYLQRCGDRGARQPRVGHDLL